MRTFKEYTEDRDSQDVGPEVTAPGQVQTDPDKPDKTTDLVSALEEIAELAKRALELREKGLGDLTGNGDPNDEDSDDSSMKKSLDRPSADNAEGMFGNSD